MSNYIVKADANELFNNHIHNCVGTGRMDLALHKEYVEQLKLVQEEIGFDFIRGHGLFCKDMAIYQELEQEDGTILEEYNFTYLDQVVDMYQDLNIRPYLELGFMPEKMASGEQTVFYWKGNVTPPADYDKWVRLVQATLRHLMERYGEKEVLTWPVEVWNEPNLPTFWKDADMQEYFHLYEVTARAVKGVHPDFRVGGPAICGVDDERWLREFLNFVEEKELPLDIVTRHHYTSYQPERSGHYGFIELHKPEDAFGVLEKSREIVDSYDRFRDMEIHITEFNTSYIPNAPIHDTCLNAAYVAHMLSRLGDKHTSYSYWTFGDVFEEFGAPFTPFHGGFGLVANACIPKPTFWTFAFYKKLQGTCIHRSEEALITKQDGTYYGVAWNPDWYGDRNQSELSFSIEVLEAKEEDEYMMVVKTVDENHGNPLRVWHEMGEPANPTREQNALLRDVAKPSISTANLVVENGMLNVKLTLQPNAVQAFELKKIRRSQDTGYSYERALSQYVGSHEEL